MDDPTQSEPGETIPIEFYKVIRDLVRDLLITFPERKDRLDDDIRCVVMSSDTETLSPETHASLNILFEHCKQVFPERFFDILYQNTDMFAG